MSSNKKYFIQYCRVSVSEGLNIELNTSELMLEKFNKEVYWTCKHCHCTIEIKKAFIENESLWYVHQSFKKWRQNQPKYIYYLDRKSKV